jgi:restriction system protein
MKFAMAKNSLFAVLLRSPWWASAAVAAAIAMFSIAVLPDAWRVVGALSGFPFLVIAGLAAWRQRLLPNAERVEATREAVSRMAWPAFARLLEQAFRRDGYTVTQGKPDAAADFVLERQGRRMLVSARRWKSAHLAVEPLRALQRSREAQEDLPTDALVVALGAPTEAARAYAAEHRITVWQAAEVAQALRGLPLAA